jgi:RNA polymerase sigma factor (sigma-70 family)
VARTINQAARRWFGTLFSTGVLQATTDAQLLERFAIGDRETADLAMSALIERHGPMVMGTCRAVLHDEHDAQDAFQSTFLVLVQKARALWVRDSLGPWLHGVAYRAAHTLRSTRSRRSLHERRVAEMTPEACHDDRDRSELARVLHEEIERLGSRHRAVIVLCDLEGQTHEQAAERLGCPAGTVKSRLARGRDRLRDRLLRRGLAPAAGIAATLASHRARAGVPPAVSAETARMAMHVAAGSAAGAVPAAVMALAREVGISMFMAKVKAISAGLLVLAALGAAAGRLLATKVSADGAPTATAARDGDNPRGEEPGPIVVRQDAQFAQAVWSAGGDVIAAISRRFEVAERNGVNGPVKALIPFDAIKLWDARTGELKRLLEQEEKNRHLVAIASSPDKRYLAIAGTRPGPDKRLPEYFVRILDARTFAVQQEIDEVPNPGALAFSPDGKTLAIGGEYPLAETGIFVKLWDVEREQMRGGTRFRAAGSQAAVPILGSPPPMDLMVDLAFSPDGKLVAAAVCSDEFKRAKIRLFNGQTGDFQRELVVSEGDRPPLGFQAAFSADGKQVITADGPVRLWDVETGKLRRTLTPPGGAVTTSLAVSPDGKHLAAGGHRGKNEQMTAVLLLWDLKTGEARDVLPWQDTAMFVASVAFSFDGTSLAVAGMAGAADPRIKDGEKTRGELCVLPVGR